MSLALATPVNDQEATSSSARDFMYSNEAKQQILLELARNYKGIDPTIDQRIDDAASIIAGDDRVTFIAPHHRGAPKVPLYLEGEPGQGKTSVIEAACRQFCEIAGLNFVTEPEDGYVLKPNDFYFVQVNLSGAQNKSDFGGMMVRTQAQADEFIKVRRKASAVGSMVLDEFTSRSKGMVDLANANGSGIKLSTSNYDIGSLECSEYDLTDDGAMVPLIAETLIKSISDASKKQGVGLSKIQDGHDPQDDRISYSISSPAKGTTRVSVYAPKMLAQQDEFASAVLPSVRFAKFKKARFGLVNFDDVANANENIRNILLEVIQKGRYSGTMDIGKAYVTLSANQGAEDGTNVFSRMSDAELTRVRKVSVRDRPEDWAQRVEEKYTSPVGSCHFAPFVFRLGSVPGIFAPDPKNRGRRGERKSNGRALENALEVVSQHYLAAHHAGISPIVFMDSIERDVRDCAGKVVATQYVTFAKQMLNDAIPLADNLIKNGKWNSSLFDRRSDGANSSAGKDFCFQVAAALSDSVVSYSRSRKDGDQQDALVRLEAAITRSCTALAAMCAISSADTMNFATASIARRLTQHPEFSTTNKGQRRLSGEATEAIAKGFQQAIVNGAWPDQETADRAAKNFTTSITGCNVSTVSSKKKPAARP